MKPMDKEWAALNKWLSLAMRETLETLKFPKGK